MTTILFVAFLVATVAIVIGAIARYLGGEAARRVAGALAAWLVVAGLLSYLGVVANTTMRPPGTALIAFPVVAFLVYFVARGSRSKRVVEAFPLWLLLGLQTFRVGVELFLHRLATDGIVPEMLTFRGANVDIYIGGTALVVAWLSTRGRGGQSLALGWNVLGLLVLTNVVVRAVLTTPGPLQLIHAEVPNRMFGTFPFTFIPAFFVPLAAMLHVLAIRKLRVGTTVPFGSVRTSARPDREL